MWRYIVVLITCMSCFIFSSLSARSVTSIPQYDYDFHQDKMMVDHGEIFLISTFEKEDIVSAYDFNGQRIWESRFHAKIISWNIQLNVILIFSKARDSSKTYLTCLNRSTGYVLWERP